jgi:toluene monooxygenase system protein D
MENAVGPVLRMSEDIPAIVAAIEDDNPGVAVEVLDRGSYVRIQAPGRLTVTRESIARNIGRSGYEMRELEVLLASFAGRIANTSEAITWQYASQPDRERVEHG